MPSRASCGSPWATRSGSPARTASRVGPGASGTPSRRGSTRHRSPSCSRRWPRSSRSTGGASGWRRARSRYLGLEGTVISPDVTVRHLLTHTSGIGDDADEEAGESYEEVWRDRPNYSVREAIDFLPQFVHRAPNFPPGQGCRYNNCGYVLLGLMVERATGRPYRDVVREDVFAPAGMSDSDFLSMDRVNERLAEGADPIRDEAGAITGWKRNIYSYPPIGSPDGGAQVTAADLDRFMRAVLEGRLLSAELTAAFLAPQVVHSVRDGWVEHYGFGPWFRVNDDGTLVFLEKEGSNAGVSGLVRHYPARDLTVVMLSNLEDGVWEPIRTAHEMVMAGAFD